MFSSEHGGKEYELEHGHEHGHEHKHTHIDSAVVTPEMASKAMAFAGG